MENLEKVVGSKGSSSNVSNNSTPSLNQPQFAKQENQQQQPFKVTPNSSETNKDSSAVQETQEEAQQNQEKQEFNEHKFIRDCLSIIDHVALDAEMLRQQVENFSGTSTDDKDYIYLEEMLIRATIALDNIDTEGNALIRQERKRAIQYVQKLMRILDARLKENKHNIRYCNNRHSSDDSDDGV